MFLSGLTRSVASNQALELVPMSYELLFWLDLKQVLEQ